MKASGRGKLVAASSTRHMCNYMGVDHPIRPFQLR